jgi:hypothetical protein
VLSGFVDFYLLAPFDRATRPRLKKVRDTSREELTPA